MKLMALSIAGVVAASALTPVAAQAHPRDHGWNRGGPGWDRGPGWNRGPGWDRGRHWGRGARWDRGPRWARGRQWGSVRTICRWQDSYYGPVRRCFQTRW